MRSSKCNEFIVHFLFRCSQLERFDDTSYFCESLCDRAVLSKTNKSPLYFSNVHLYLLQCSSGKDVRIVTVSGPWWWETRKKAAVLSHDTRCCQTPAAEPRTSVWSCLIYFWLLVLLHNVCVWIHEYAALHFLWCRLCVNIIKFLFFNQGDEPSCNKATSETLTHLCCHLHLCERKQRTEQSQCSPFKNRLG